jgi:hypothetical protein
LAQVKAALVRDVDNPDRLPVVLTAGVTLDPNQGAGTAHFDICWEPGCVSLVPFGYRLIIDSVSVRGIFREDLPLQLASVRSTANRRSIETPIQAPVQALELGGDVHYSGTVPVHIYCDSTTAVDAFVTRGSGGGGFQRGMTFTAYGHFVSLN